MKFAIAAAAALFLCSGSISFADAQCRFIDKRAEREACYAREDEARAAKAKAAEEAAKKAAVASPPLSDEDRALFRTLHSICRGC